jgi:hypothetical protein
VKQKQIVGYVGSTGLSTGPHLDYRLAKDGKFRNPLKESSPAGAPVAKKEWEAFQKVRDDRLNRLEGDASAHSLRDPLPSEKEGGRTDGTTAGSALSR